MQGPERVAIKSKEWSKCTRMRAKKRADEGKLSRRKKIQELRKNATPEAARMVPPPPPAPTLDRAQSEVLPPLPSLPDILPRY